MKILITGGSGFIGNHLTSVLSKKHQVSVLDINSSNVDTPFIKADIHNLSEIRDAVKDFDVVIHLAALVGVENSENDPIKTLDFNINGTRNILDACVSNNIGKIIFSSSSEIYGQPLSVPINESDPKIPITTYGISKLAAEEYVKSYSKKHGINYTILRFFNVYGPNQSLNFVMSRFINLALQHKPITIHGDGKQIRAFCHIEDIVRAIGLVLEDGNNEIFNIGNSSEPICIKDLSQKIISMTNSKSEQVFVPFEKSNRNRNEILTRIPVIDKAKNLINYSPKISLDVGIQSMIDSLRQ